MAAQEQARVRQAAEQTSDKDQVVVRLHAEEVSVAEASCNRPGEASGPSPRKKKIMVVERRLL